MADLNSNIRAILKLIAEFENVASMTDEQLQALADQRAAAARARMQKRNERFQQMLSSASDVQAMRVDRIEADGYQVTKAFQSRATGRVAIMLQKEGVFDQQTSRIRCKLAMVYPDGRHQYAFTKIAVHNDWL